VVYGYCTATPLERCVRGKIFKGLETAWSGCLVPRLLTFGRRLGKASLCRRVVVEGVS
jgi:hypothetical protein